ncbi:MAG TPA: FAD/NAD(P)-binding oxidoreductase, partial [Pelolinea sp.]|nr:FAD/NAD(P)-binding oxidoreductase [Pelolinea sp.]
MDKYEYLIVGGGMTADSAVTGIRELDQDSEILIISADENPPYNRPPLSKALWKDKKVDSIWRKTVEKKVNLKLGKQVISINPDKKEVTDDTNQIYGFEKLLIATGGKPRKLPFGGEDVIYYRSLSDYEKLHALSESKQNFAVIGSGFIGSEIAAALAMNGKEVLLFDIGPGIGWNIFPPVLTEFLNGYYKEKGVSVIPNVTVNNISSKSLGFDIALTNGERFETDAVVAGVGIHPDVELAEKTGFKVSNGIVVNELLESKFDDIFAAGDVANFYNPLLEKRIRVEHADNANEMGKQAGRNMAGAGENYDYLPFFYSDLFDLGYEAVGQLDSRSEIVED